VGTGGRGGCYLLSHSFPSSITGIFFSILVYQGWSPGVTLAIGSLGVQWPGLYSLGLVCQGVMVFWASVMYIVMGPHVW